MSEQAKQASKRRQGSWCKSQATCKRNGRTEVDFWWRRRRRRRRSGRTRTSSTQIVNWNERRARRAFWPFASATQAKRRGILSGSTHTVRHVAPNYRFIISFYPFIASCVDACLVPNRQLAVCDYWYPDISLSDSLPLFKFLSPPRSSNLGIWFSGVSFITPSPSPEISGCGFQLWPLEVPPWNLRIWFFGSETWSPTPGPAMSGYCFQVWTLKFQPRPWLSCVNLEVSIQVLNDQDLVFVCEPLTWKLGISFEVPTQDLIFRCEFFTSQNVG